MEWSILGFFFKRTKSPFLRPWWVFLVVQCLRSVRAGSAEKNSRKTHKKSAKLTAWDLHKPQEKVYHLLLSVSKTKQKTQAPGLFFLLSPIPHLSVCAWFFFLVFFFFFFYFSSTSTEFWNRKLRANSQKRSIIPVKHKSELLDGIKIKKTTHFSLFSLRTRPSWLLFLELLPPLPPRLTPRGRSFGLSLTFYWLNAKKPVAP